MLIVRRTTVDDIEELLRIKADPLVAHFQYPVNVKAYTGFLHRVLGYNNETAGFTTEHSTIEQHNNVIGYIQHTHYCVDNVKSVYCSWNLTSTLWGQGIMRSALTQLINGWIFEGGTQQIFADHFRKNQRCRRLMNRLGFSTQEIGIAERITTAWQQRCLKWIVRRRLDAKNWPALSHSPT